MNKSAEYIKTLYNPEKQILSPKDISIPLYNIHHTVGDTMVFLCGKTYYGLRIKSIK